MATARTSLIVEPGDVVIDLDATLSLSTRYPSKVPQYPVETGDSISDHVVLEPLEISISAIVSNVPLEDLQPITAAGERVAAVRAALEAARNARKGITVVTPLDYFARMYVTALELPRALEHSGGQRIELTLQQVNQVSAEYTKVTKVKKVLKGKGHTAAKTDSKPTGLLATAAVAAAVKTEMVRQTAVDALGSLLHGGVP